MNEPTREEVADALDRTADVLWMYGRCRGDAHDEAGRFCVRGAMCEAVGITPRPFGLTGFVHEVDRALCSWLARNPVVLGFMAHQHKQWVDRGDFPSWAWNDTTADDELVIDSLRRCAKELREEAGAS